MQPLIRPEYVDAAIEKAVDPDQVGELKAIQAEAQALGAQEQATLLQCVENRVAAGEKRKRTRAPSSVKSAGERAADDIHAMQQRQCRRAASPSEIIDSLRTLLRGDVDFNRPLLAYIDPPANLALNESLMAGKDALLARFDRFLARWPLAS